MRAFGLALTLASVCMLTACGASLGNAPSSATQSEAPKYVLGSGSAPVEPASSAARAEVTSSIANAPGAAAESFVSASIPGNTAYKIGPHDVIEVSVFKVPDLSKATQVSDSGTVNLPLVGEVRAGGLTAQELERELTRLLGAKYLQKPQVTVYIREFNSQRITLEGAVKKPGVYPMRGKTSLLQSIALAEGLDPSADSTVVVFRQTDRGKSAARFDVAAIRTGGIDDPALQAGDVVVVSTSLMKESFNSVVKMLPLLAVFTLI